MTKSQFQLLVALLFVGVILAFAVPLLVYSEDSYEIRPEPARSDPREPVIRAGDRPATYNPLDDM